MAEDGKSPRWSLSERDLADLSPQKVRDLIVACFFYAQKETFARAKERLGKTASDDEILDSVIAAVHLVFKEIGRSFENPSADDLEQVIGVLAKKAAGWGTPEDVVRHHLDQIQRAISLLPR